MVSLADALRELRGPRTQRDMAALTHLHLRSYTRLEQGALCRFPTIDRILTRTGATPHTRAIVCLAWIHEQIGKVNFEAVSSQLKSSCHVVQNVVQNVEHCK
jgi:hypothetical protein